MAKPIKPIEESVRPDKDLTQTSDAQLWAERFAQAFYAIYPESGIELDEGWLIGWFANAIAVGDLFCYHNSHGRKWVEVHPGPGETLDEFRARLEWISEGERKRLVNWIADEYGQESDGEN